MRNSGDQGRRRADRPPVPPDALFLTVEQGAALLGLGRTAVYELIKNGDLPSIAIGRSRRLARAEVEQFVTDRMQESRTRQKMPKSRRSRERRTLRQDVLFNVNGQPPGAA
jgi:excisionase family DNA binding protein